jgi:hypothetical protein
MADQIVESIATGAFTGQSQSRSGNRMAAAATTLGNLIRAFRKAWANSGAILAGQIDTRERDVNQADSDLRSFT